MCFRVPIAAAALLAVAAGPVLAQRTPSDKPAPEKPAGPAKIAGKTLQQWVKEITDGRDPGRREAAIRTVPYFRTSEAAGKAVAAEAVRPLLAILKDDHDAGCRVYAALTLANLAPDVTDPDGAGEAVKVLVNRLQYDPQAIVRLHIVFAVGSFGPRATAAIPLLIKHIRDPLAWELRQAALGALARVAQAVGKEPPDGAAVAAIAKLLSAGDEKSAQVRLAAVNALYAMGKPAGEDLKLAKAALEKATTDKDHSVAIWAWVALMTLDGVDAARLDMVAGYLADKDPMTRATAAMALGALRDRGRSKMDRIIELLDDKDPLVVAAAIDVLAGYEKFAEKAVPELRKVMARKDYANYFGPAAADAISKITGKEEKAPAPTNTGSALTKPPVPKEVGGKSLADWIKEIKDGRDPSVQQTAMRAVPVFGDKAYTAVPALLYRLQDTEHRDIAVRAHAILALMAIADSVKDEDATKVVKALTAVLDSDQVILRYHAASALGVYNARAASAVPALINRMHDPNSWELRQAAAAALSTAAVGTNQAGPDARAIAAVANRLLNNEERSGAVRMMLVMTLGALGRPANFREINLATNALNQVRASDPDKSVQIWADVALMAVQNKVTAAGLDDVARHLAKGKDVASRLTAARALLAMGKEARPKIGDIAKMLDDDDPIVMAGALEVLAGFGPTAHEAVPAIRRFADKLDQNKTMTKDQRDYFKDAAKYAIEQIDGVPKK